VTSSLAYMKKIVEYSVGNIAYLRGLLPQHNYTTEQLEDLQIPVLNTKSKNKESERLNAWLQQGVYEALEKSYLQKMLAKF